MEGWFQSWASRAHLELQTITKKAFKESGIKIEEIDFFQPLVAPVSLRSFNWFTFTKSLSIGMQKPFVPINHLEAHILSSFNNKLHSPFVPS